MIWRESEDVVIPVFPPLVSAKRIREAEGVGRSLDMAVINKVLRWRFKSSYFEEHNF